MCFSSRPCGSAMAFRSGPASDQTPQQADLARIVGQKNSRWSLIDGRSRGSLGFANDQRLATNDYLLLAIQFDYQLFIDRQLDVFAFRQRDHAALIVLAIDLQPHRRRLMTGKILRGFENRHLAAALANRNLFAHADLVRRDVHLAPIHLHVPVTHQLARLAAGNAEAQPVDHVVQTPLELLKQLRARYSLELDRFLEVIPELPFLGEVNAFGFLFLAQLQTIAYNLGLLVFPVLSGSEVTLLDRTFIAKALGAFEEEL